MRNVVDLTDCDEEIIAALYSVHRMFVCETCEGTGIEGVYQEYRPFGGKPIYLRISEQPCMCCFTFGFHYDYEYNLS